MDLTLDGKSGGRGWWMVNGYHKNKKKVFDWDFQQYGILSVWDFISTGSDSFANDAMFSVVIDDRLH